MLRRFPAPWTVVETTGEFSVKDATGRTLGYFYWWGDGTTALLTRDEAKFLADNFGNLPNIMLRSVPVEGGSSEEN